MTSDRSSWKRMRFKKYKVWVQVDPRDRPLVKDGKARIKYQLDQPYEYRVRLENLKSLDTFGPADGKPQAKRKKRPGPVSEKAANQAMADIDGPRAIVIYTDGASSGNPGPSGIGVVLEYGEHEKEISRYIGRATNNIAELEAIKVALLSLKTTDLPVRIHTDSNYAYGLLALGWKPKKNIRLVTKIMDLMKKFRDLKLIKVKGHAGVVGNEKADSLATAAIELHGNG